MALFAFESGKVGADPCPASGASVLLLPLSPGSLGEQHQVRYPVGSTKTHHFLKSMNEYISYSFSFLLLLVWECTPCARMAGGAEGPWWVALDPDL